MTTLQPPQSANQTELRTVILAGGCFWCQDPIYRATNGVKDVEVGYIGGHIDQPTYEQVCTGTTGHAEAIKVTFNPETLPVEVLLDIFFTTHDPTTLNRQGNDVGPQYRSAMFAFDQQDRADFEAAIQRHQPSWDHPIVTAIEPGATWWPAEEVHQDFFARNPHHGYCHFVINPKLAKFKKDYSAWLSTSRDDAGFPYH